MTGEDLLPRYEEALRKCAELLEFQAVSARHLSTLAHDLRNPVSSIISSCDYLTAYCIDSLDPEQADMIARIETSARTLLECSDRIRDIASQMSAGTSG